MNNRIPDEILNKHYIEQLKTNQRAEFKTLRTELGRMDGPVREVTGKLVNRPIDTDIPTKVTLRFVIDEPQMMRLFDICNFIDCS